MKMSICVATMKERRSAYSFPGDIGLAVSNAEITPVRVHVLYNIPEQNLGVVGSYNRLYQNSSEEILCFMHDDVIVREKGWDARVLKEFEDPSVGLVGFGGAKWHGTPDLYKVPYKLENLRRGDYLSNTDDAEVHGERFDSSTDVAVLDGYCLCVRRRLLDDIDGFSRFGCDFYCYDYALSAHCRRLGYRVRCVGVRCHHRGGGTSVGKETSEITSQKAYDASHRWFYENFRDVMPARVK